MQNDDQLPDQYYSKGNQNYMTQGGLPLQCVFDQQGNPVYYQQMQSDKNYQGSYHYASSMMANQQQTNPQQMNPQQVSLPQMHPQQRNPQPINPTQRALQQLNTQQMNLQHLNSQQMNLQQLNPHQMNPQKLNPHQMNPQKLNPQQMNPQQLNTHQRNPQKLNPQQMNAPQMNPQQINAMYITNEAVQQEMQQKNIHMQPRMNPQSQLGGYSLQDIPSINNNSMYQTPNEQSHSISNQGQICNKNLMTNQIHQSNSISQGQQQALQQPQDNSLIIHPSNDSTDAPMMMSSIVKDLFNHVLAYVQRNNGPTGLTRQLITNYLSNKMKPEIFVNTMAMRKIFTFSSEQSKIIFDYSMQLNQSHREEKNPNTAANVQPMKPSMNVQRANPGSQIRQAHQPTVTTSLGINPPISSMPNVRIPQLTMVQNNHVQSTSNITMSNVRSAHAIPPVGGQNILKEFSDIHEANMSIAAKTNNPEIKQDVADDDEADFEICGINIKEEEKLMHKFDQLDKMKSFTQKGLFDKSIIHGILIKICNKNKITVSAESANKIGMILAIALEVKVRAILSKATKFVHNRLKNYDIKCPRYLVSNLEQQFELLEEFTTARDPKKAADRNRVKNKAETDKKKRQMEEAITRSNATNEVVMAAVKGRKIENFNQMNINDSKVGGTQTYSDSLMHQRLRQSAQKQRRIYKRDIMYVFQSDPTLRRFIIFF